MGRSGEVLHRNYCCLSIASRWGTSASNVAFLQQIVSRRLHGNDRRCAGSDLPMLLLDPSGMVETGRTEKPPHVAGNVN